MQKIISGIITLVIMYCVFNCGDNKSDNKSDYAGTYTTTDAVGTKFTFILSEDGTVECVEEYKTIYAVANSYSKNNEYGKYQQTATKTYYGSSSIFKGGKQCWLTIKDGPRLYYSANETSEESYSYNYIIYDGYIYVGSDDADAKHPKRRLKLIKQ